MSNVKLNRMSPAAPEPSSEYQVDSCVVEVAWEYCNRVRNGDDPPVTDFLERLPDNRSREEFHMLLALNEFVGHIVDYQVNRIADHAP